MRIREATLIDKAIDKHYIVITMDTGKQFSIEFDNTERETARYIVIALNDKEE